MTLGRFVSACSLLSMACAHESSSPSPAAAPASVSASQAVERPDPHSYAMPQHVRVEHLGLRLEVDFAARQLKGSATLRVVRLDPKATLDLDTRELEIQEVLAAQAGPTPPGALAEWEPSGPWMPAPWSLEERSPILGQALRISLPAKTDIVRIRYETSTGATGLQWLEPEQTADRSDGFLYTQSQAIHARSWLPCQDTPGVRATYDAVVVAAPHLRALMAAQMQPASTPGRHVFTMPEPVPAYLMALAVGRLEFQALGPRTGVWAEPSRLQAAASEFADVESMLRVGEALYGPYRWGRYDLLVLPPAFPFGGMENPRLTFATPTILAGDRSLVSLVAHELAHSWSGNLVTNATWADLWLNEGFTVYFERRIVEEIYGRTRAEMEAVLGRQELEVGLGELPPELTSLALDLRGRDPDDGLTVVPYEKGALFLRLLEESYGRPAFDAFLQRWFAEHAFTSVSTATFLAFLQTHLLGPGVLLPGRPPVDVDAWVYGHGLGPSAPRPTSEAFTAVDDARARFVAGSLAAPALPAGAWVPQQWLRFLRELPLDVPVERLQQLDAAWRLTASGNAEILAQWLEVGVRSGYREVDARLEAFLRGVGRRKFLTPLYRALLAAGRREDALRIYAAARPGYHAIARSSLDDLLAPPPSATPATEGF